MDRSPSLRQSLRIQARVLYALLMREVITRFGRENLGVMWLAVEPMLFTTGVAALWTAAGVHHGISIPIVAFAITGYSSVLMWRNATTRCAAAIEQNKGLLYHRNVQVIDVMLTRIAVEEGGATASFLILSSAAMFLGWMPPPVDALRVVFGWAMLAWFGIALALLMGAASAFSDIAERLWHPVSYLLFPLSGAAFMVAWLPTGAQPYVLLLPMVHGVELLREGWFGNAVQTHHDIGYMAGACLVMSLVAMWLVRVAGRKVEA